VIELWLACRNEPELAATLDPTIARIRDLANPQANASLGERLGRSEDAVAFYRLMLEAMIGMALGRALSPTGTLGHEDQVMRLLRLFGRDVLVT
jgi:hypothetical protein